jgi:3'-phosphoadenosine 5'-phosphosulfate sulfotransferase (PAPS reductase)/FAD synthetase
LQWSCWCCRCIWCPLRTPVFLWSKQNNWQWLNEVKLSGYHEGDRSKNFWVCPQKVLFFGATETPKTQSFSDERDSLFILTQEISDDSSRKGGPEIH